MRKKELRELEAAVRQLAATDYEATPERVQEIKRRAFEQYEAYIAKKQEKKKRLSRWLTVAVMAVFLFLSPLLYQSLAPMPNGNASGFFRQISVWLSGGSLHTAIEVPAEKSRESGVAFEGEYRFSSVQEAAERTHNPIICFPETDSVKLLAIEGYQAAGAYELNLHYETPEGRTTILIKPMYDRNAVAFREETAIVQTDVGPVYVWGNPPYTKALLYSDAYEISFISHETLEAFSALLASLEKYTE